MTSSDAAVEAGDRGESVILVRDETSPEDVRGMAKAAGVLTARGGWRRTPPSLHVAGASRRLSVPGVTCSSLAAGERISIDGSSGEVFRGELAGEWQVAPEAATLLEWARELGIEVASPAESCAVRDSRGP